MQPTWPAGPIKPPSGKGAPSRRRSRCRRAGRPSAAAAPPPWRGAAAAAAARAARPRAAPPVRLRLLLLAVPVLAVLLQQHLGHAPHPPTAPRSSCSARAEAERGGAPAQARARGRAVVTVDGLSKPANRLCAERLCLSPAAVGSPLQLLSSAKVRKNREREKWEKAIYLEMVCTRLVNWVAGKQPDTPTPTHPAGPRRVTGCTNARLFASRCGTKRMQNIGKICLVKRALGDLGGACGIVGGCCRRLRAAGSTACTC